jgi:hypothetical protein
MEYCIFLKSLRILEEFRKNPHIQIPLNLHLQIPKALAIFKIHISFRKEFSLAFGPVGPTGLPSCAAHAAQPAQGDALLPP